MKIPSLILIILLAATIVLCKNTLFENYTARETISISSLAIYPPDIAKIAVLEFPGIFSDYLFLNTLTYLGDRILAKKPLSSSDLNKVYIALSLITDLDPWADDPYVLAETTLPWEGNMVTETNQLLLKSIEANPHNFRTYLFLWFNHFHFLNDPEKAGYYLEQSARIPGVPEYYATLAARMKLYAGKLEQGILFLQALIMETSDPNHKAFLQLRQDTLKRMAFLESKVQKYREKYGTLPKNLDELITAGLLNEIPDDPYGGEFYLLENGRVNTTSKLVPIDKLPPETREQK